MEEDDSLVADAASRIFRDLGDPQTLTAATDEAWKGPLWSALEEAGLTLAWVSDEHGGAGAGIGAGFAVLQVAGQYAVPLPLAETLLAGWLLGEAGITVPAGAMTVAPAQPGDELVLGDDGKLSGSAREVPFGREVGHIAVLARRGEERVVALVAAGEAHCHDGANPAGEGRGRVDFDGAEPLQVATAPAGLDETALLRLGAASRAMQMAGALQAVLDISVQYAEERVAFGRPIGKFQAVQHNLACLAEEAAAAVAIANSAAYTVGREGGLGPAGFLDIASAKIRVGEAAGQGAAIGHQVLGAIGFTDEHILHRYTQRLWSWRDDFGAEAVWAVELGRHAARQGGEGLWWALTAA
ncbi:MAG: acyl-CoA dehydrogenase family protein [Alphaproteobacteria bacterium]|jgi:alkylation response protein AidB-like acyl-CoA dehydrogenase|nr:acyl-CoA dehydrogenase family protein [Alphaproteobacteria bacterium]MDP6566554.1 acyl-CoA dehydrogenase family protein [Alphaproteobacteria bacterium]MDP6813664.1 acyl-CoA dehydrogenase family protein [Alphaproteobacteria bacterium]